MMKTLVFGCLVAVTLCSATTLVHFSPQQQGYTPGAPAVAPGFAYAFRALAPPLAPSAYYTSSPHAIVQPIHTPVVKTQYHSQDELGQYAYGYVGGDSTKHEVRTADGGVRGSYSYIDSNGVPQTTNYIADKYGYRVQATNLPVDTSAAHAPLPVRETPEVAAARAAHLRTVHAARASILGRRVRRDAHIKGYSYSKPSVPFNYPKPVISHVQDDYLPPVLETQYIPHAPVLNDYIPHAPFVNDYIHHVPAVNDYIPHAPAVNDYIPPIVDHHHKSTVIEHDYIPPVRDYHYAPAVIDHQYAPAVIDQGYDVPTLSRRNPIPSTNSFIPNPQIYSMRHYSPLARNLLTPVTRLHHLRPVPLDSFGQQSLFRHNVVGDSPVRALTPPLIGTGSTSHVVVQPASLPPQIVSQYHSQDEHGQYEYGYSGGPSSKHEVRTADGVTRGGYSYIDGYGEIQTVYYIADPINGFRVAATNLPEAPLPLH